MKNTFQIDQKSRPTPGANLINLILAFLKPSCVLIFLVAYFDSYEKFKCFNFLLRLKNSLKP